MRDFPKTGKECFAQLDEMLSETVNPSKRLATMTKGARCKKKTTFAIDIDIFFITFAHKF